MPPIRRRKKKETIELDNFMQMDENELRDIKKTVEIPVNEIDPKTIETVEKIGNKEKIKKLAKQNARKRSLSKTRAYEQKIKSIDKIVPGKRGNYELIITEKPQAAAKIASALGDPVKKTVAGVSYYEINKAGKKIYIACAVGHLFTLKQDAGNGKTLPIFNVKWVPNYQTAQSAFTKRYYTILANLAQKSSTFTVATDYDIEGEVIGFNIIRFICQQKDANRMKFSTLTPKELREAYDNKAGMINWGQAIAGESRHYLDWFYGINLSRALMESIKSAGSFKIMSIGRVQGPALNLIVQKEREIQKFKPQKYWQIFITIDKHNLELKYIKDIFNEKELTQFDNLNGKKAEALTTSSEQKIVPGVPFDLTTLQTEAYKFHGITPAKTLQIAQSLYLAGLISYPRTSSQKLPISIAYNEILERVAKNYNAEKFITRKQPIEGKKSDPAHPSIYPTGEYQSLQGEEKKIYDLIAKRFIALFCGDAIISNKKVAVEANGLKFTTSGVAIKEKGWMNIYPIKLQEKEIPNVNGTVTIKNVKKEEKETQPPRRYSPASIVSELEKRNLGTKATRASIVETLYDRGYVAGTSIEATPIGMSLISTLEKYSPIIIDEQLTRQFEKEMDEIQSSKKDLEAKEERIIGEAKQVITKIIGSFETNKNKIGSELIKANLEYREEQKKENILMECPVCHKGQLAITFSPKNRRYFIACNAYPECKTTFSLPPNGLIKKTDKICPQCGFPMLIRLQKGSRPWTFCFNPQCPSRKQIEKVEKK